MKARVLGTFPVWMAPMAGVTDKPFRRIIKEMGCGLAFTEMISGKAIQFNNRRTWNMLDLEGESPAAVQLFGSEPEVMAAAAKVAVAEGAEFLDINMGCPVPKIVGNGEGAALMREPELAASIVRAVVDVVGIPVTVKFRTGWDQNSINAVPFAQAMEQAGAAAVTVHGRTRDQMYSGKADWKVIAQVVKAVSIPVMGNGDIWTGADAADMLQQTGCSGVMLARGVMGNPWLFEEVVAALNNQNYTRPTPAQRIQLAIRHFKMELDYRDQRMAVLYMRKHLAWYLKGLPGTGETKKQIFRLTEPAAIEELLLGYLDTL